MAGHGKDGRAIKRAFDRLNGTATVEKTAIGHLPATDSFDTNGIQINGANLQAFTSFAYPGWREAVPQIRDAYNALPEFL